MNRLNELRAQYVVAEEGCSLEDWITFESNLSDAWPDIEQAIEELKQVRDGLADLGTFPHTVSEIDEKLAPLLEEPE